MDWTKFIKRCEKRLINRAARLLTRGDEYDEYFVACIRALDEGNKLGRARTKLGSVYEIVLRMEPATNEVTTVTEIKNKKEVTNHGSEF